MNRKQNNFKEEERTQHGIATSDSVSRAVDSFCAAQLPAYVDGTLGHSST